jgi:hypothetical protein
MEEERKKYKVFISKKINYSIKNRQQRFLKELVIGTGEKVQHHYIIREVK